MAKMLYIFFFLSSFTLIGQDYTLEKVNEIPLETDRFIAVDKFNALYHIKNDILFKRDVGNEYQYSALQLGKISSVDVLNPLRITLYYESANTAVVLDNTLNEIARVNFSTIENFRNVSHVTTASDRRFWIYNTDLQQLEIFDWNRGKVITQFPPMEELALEFASNFNFAWVSTKDDISYYNNYGSFLEKIDIPDAQIMAQDKGNVIAFAKAKLYYKPKDAMSFVIIDTPDLTLEQLSLKDEILYIYGNQKLITFRLQSTK